MGAFRVGAATTQSRISGGDLPCAERGDRKQPVFTNTADATGVWLIGMRYKIMNANTTVQVAQGYKELKMEVGAKGGSFMGLSQSAKGGVGLDTMVQRLVQTAVWDIDAKHK